MPPPPAPLALFSDNQQHAWEPRGVTRMRDSRLTPTQHCRHPIQWLADSRHLSELACLIDAMPSVQRPTILRAAVDALPRTDFVGDFLTGVCRSHLLDCLVELTGGVPRLDGHLALDKTKMNERLESFSQVQDPAQSAFALCDLLSVLLPSIATGNALFGRRADEGRQK